MRVKRAKIISKYHSYASPMVQTELIELRLIDSSKKQARKEFDSAKLQELSDSIRENGVLQPILVRRKGDNRYEIIAGERRVRASKLAGLAQIPAIIKDSDDVNTMLDSYLENAQREDLTPAEKEDALVALWKTGKFNTPRELDKALGYGSGYSANVIEAREFRDKYKVPESIATTTITSSKGLPDDIRKRVLQRVSQDEGKYGQVRTVRDIKEIIEKAPPGITDGLLSGKITTNEADKAVELYQSADKSNVKPLAKAIEKGEINIASAEKTLKLYSELTRKGVKLDENIVKRDLDEVRRQNALDEAHERIMTQARASVLSGSQKSIDFRVVDPGNSFLQEVSDTAWRIKRWGVQDMMLIGAKRWEVAMNYFKDMDTKIHSLLGLDKEKR